MKRFIAKLLVLATISTALLGAILGIRVISWNKKVESIFHIEQNVKVLCVGNSHTGCTWAESHEFSNQVFWQPGTSFIVARMKLQELERNNDLKNIDVLLMDFDFGSFFKYEDEEITKLIIQGFPVYWRYLGSLDGGLSLKVGISAILNNGKLFGLAEKVKKENRRWVELSSEEKQSNIKRICNQWKNVDVNIERHQSRILKDLEIVKDIAERNNIRLVLYASPLVSDNPYRNAFSVKFHSLISTVREKGFEWYDFRDMMNDSDFRDCDHLSVSGSRKFTELVWNLLGIEVM